MEKILQPNSRQCFVCGLSNTFGLHLRFYNLSPGEVTAECVLPEQYQGFPGIVHGGVVAAMLDEAAGRSLMISETASALNPRFMFTARLYIRYRNNVPVGKTLRLVGKAGKSKARTAQAQAFIYDLSGTLLAQAEALLMDVPETLLPAYNLEDLGWNLYPEEETEL